MSYILECRNLTKRYGHVTALDNVSFSLESGHVVGLLGPNGSGKTTLIKLINELLTPSEGELLVDGHKPGKESKAVVSYLPDATYLDMNDTVDSVINMFVDFYADFDKARAYEMLARLNVNPHDSLKTMSKGTKEKVQLILVMSRKAKLYVLDEPIAGVDPAARDYILKIIMDNYNPGSTILISTHLIADIEGILDEVLFIREGRILLQSSKDEIVKTQGKTVDQYFREVFAC
ncbi:MAG: ABC transporter ATP-binding protein [Lachnospiraceae bacterium]|nr:ABC transporter ATP-binding protein [Lachnospiraceae bacterium]